MRFSMIHLDVLIIGGGAQALWTLRHIDGGRRLAAPVSSLHSLTQIAFGGSMSRLVWQQTPAIGDPATRAAGAVKRDDYAAKIAKYVPAEVVAFYIGVDKIVTGLPNSGGFTVTPLIQFIVSVGLFGLAWAGTPLYLARQAEPGQDWVSHVTISTVAFPIWAYAVQGTIFTNPAYTGIYNAGIAGILVAVFTFASGLFPFKWPKSGS